MPNPKKKARDNKDVVEAAYEGYAVDRIPTTMMTPSEASATNRYWQREAMMHPVGDEFWDPTELMPAVSIAGMSPVEERRAVIRGEGQRAADALSARQNYVGSKYVAPAFAATMAAPWLVGAGAYAAANPMALVDVAKNGYSWLEKSIPKALPYLQPSGWIDPLVGGASGLGAAGYYQGARTLAGGVADALFDSYWAGNAVRNMGRSGNVAGELMNAMDLLPLVGAGAAVVGRGARALDARAARRMDDAIKGFARQKGLFPSVHSATGEKVFIDSSGNPFQYINGEFVPFDANSEWTANSFRDRILDQIATTRARMNGEIPPVEHRVPVERAPEQLPPPPEEVVIPGIGEVNDDIPFYVAGDDLSMVTESQLQAMANGAGDPALAQEAVNELSRRGVYVRRPGEYSTIRVPENVDVDEMPSYIDSRSLPEPPPEVNNVADTERNVSIENLDAHLEPGADLDIDRVMPRPIGNIITDEGGLLSRDPSRLSNDELNLVLNSGHATDEHRIERGRRANRHINSWLDNTRIDETTSDELRRLYDELDNQYINHGFSEGDEEYINPEHYRRAIVRELLSRGEPVSVQTTRAATTSPTAASMAAAATPATTHSQYGTLSSGRQVEPSMRIQDLSDDEFAELENLGGVEFHRRVGAMAQRGDISADDRIALMRQYNYRRRTGRILDDDIEKAINLGDSEGYRQLINIASDGRTTLDGLYEGQTVPEKIKKLVRDGRKKLLSTFSDKELARELKRAIGDKAGVGIGTLEGNPYPVYMNDLRGDLHRAEIDALVDVLKKRFPNADVDFSKMDTIDELAALQGFLRENGLVGWDEALPLDMQSMSYFSEDDPALRERAGVIGQDLTAKMPRKTAVTENHTSTQSELMKIANAAKNYGTGPGETTLEYLKSPDGRYVMTQRNHFGNHKFTINEDGSVTFKLEKQFKKHNPDYDFSKNPFTKDEVAQLKTIWLKGRVDTPEEQVIVNKFNDLVSRADKAAIGEYERAISLYDRESGVINPRAEAIQHGLFNIGYSYLQPTFDGTGFTYSASYRSPYTVVYKHRLGGTLLRRFDGGGVITQGKPFTAYQRFMNNHPNFAHRVRKAGTLAVDLARVLPQTSLAMDFVDAFGDNDKTTADALTTRVGLIGRLGDIISGVISEGQEASPSVRKALSMENPVFKFLAAPDIVSDGLKFIRDFSTPVEKYNCGGTLLRRFDDGGGVPVFSPLADFRSSHPMTLPKPTLRISGDGFHGFGGGEFGGAGASGYWDISLDPLVASQYVRNTPIMGERSFSDAYAEARKAGLPDFMFNGQRYTTDYDPDAKLGKHKYEPTAVLNIREVLDENKKPIVDSTRIEPWIGQIPGTHERRYDGGGDIEYDIEPAIVKPAPVRVNLYTDPLTKNTPITHSWLEAGPRDGNDLGFRVSKGSYDPTYNLLLANCSDATGAVLEALSGQDFTSGITTPYGVRRKARNVFGSYPMYSETGDKTTVQSFYVPWYDYRKAKDVANSQQLETNLALAKKYGAGPEVLQQIRDTWAESHPVLPYTLDESGNVISYKKGGGIHIKPSKRGTFRAQATKMGMSVKQAAAHILAHKENYSPAMVKKANFARNFAGDGGLLERYGPDRIKEALEKIKRG